MKLHLGLEFLDLYSNIKLKELDGYFLQYLSSQDHDLYQELLEYRQSSNKIISKLIIKLAPYLEEFIANLFEIKDELDLAKEKYESLAKIYECKRLFVQRHALKSSKEISYNIEDVKSELSILISPKINEYSVDQFEQIFSEYALLWLKSQDLDKLKVATQYAIWATVEKAGIKKHKSGTLFKFPHKLDFDNLVELEIKNQGGIKSLHVAKDKCHHREGFKLTDQGCELNFAIDQANYCIHCHNQSKDSCSKGFSQDLNGCPLDEKISEMNYLKSRANIIGSLAVAIIDNPMLAATGHRICNDCMKACIYQKQQPVDIPQIETRTLKDVLDLTWGFEIYSLLTRWNPLAFSNFYPNEDSGAKVLVVGMGPAGFTLAHYLINQGHIVVGVDGLKIEPISKELLEQPIKNVNELFESLDERVIAGFGGVMEYGITNRWNKNFLLLIRLLLERRSNFKLFSGIRFGSNITPKQAFELGFQHIALALGAGSPKLLDLKDGMAKGVRTASDFLMSLQLGSAHKQESLTNLQIRMPIVVIGGGLTALDSATESLAYYPKLVEKFVTNHKSLNLTAEEKEIEMEFFSHHKLFKESSSLLDALQSLGGAKILYRNKIQKAPSYRLNHEELSLGLSEGVEFVENITPNKIILDSYGHACAIQATQVIDGIERQVTIPAKTILIAAGTVPNVVLSQEFPEFFQKSGNYFKIIQDDFITYNDGKNSISFFGDLHPKYAGNVVKAMASAKHGYRAISKLLKTDNKADIVEFFANLSEQLISKLVNINRLAPNIIELVIKSPLSAQNFYPGQFFRLQNYSGSNLPLMEGIALTGAKIEKDFISTIVLEMGDSSNLCAKLNINDPLVLMGPTGSPTEIFPNENVMLIGGGVGNAVLFSIGQAFRKQNSRVLYFAGYRKLVDRYKVEEIEAAADQIIWCCDEGALEVTRSQDQSFHGNIVQSILHFAQENQEEIKNIDRIIVIGSDKMMHAIKKARHAVLNPYLKAEHVAIASINSPMQCMMKEICGQCLQKHIDPETLEETYVFSCVTQDQEMDRVDFYHLESRLSQNNLLEKLFLGSDFSKNKVN